MTVHQFPHADDAPFDVVHRLPAAGPPSGEAPPAPTESSCGSRAEGVNGQWLAEGGAPAAIRAWMPTGDLDADLATLAEIDRIRQACVAAIAEHSHTLGTLHQAEHREKWSEIPGGRVERRWRGHSWEWSTTEQVAQVVLETASLKEMISALPERVSWRLGDKDEGKPGLRALGIDPDEAELRHRPEGGRWELRFTHGDEQ